MSKDVRKLAVTVDDAMRAGHCPSGLRRWLHSVNINTVRFWNGEVTIAEILATNDANGRQVVEHKLKLMGMTLDGR